jgi:CRISPR/Cas system-associated endonuclease Cas1
MIRRAKYQPGTLVAQAQYLWHQRRIKAWIPFLERKIAELQERIREKAYAAEQSCPSES